MAEFLDGSKRRGKSKWPIVALLLAILAVIFFIVMLVYISKYHKLLKQQQVVSETQKDAKESEGSASTALPTPTTTTTVPSQAVVKSSKIFSDLTAEQYEAIIQYVLDISELGVVPSKEANLTSNYIFSIDLVLPNKEDVLTYLDNENAAMPVAKAKVILFMGASNPKAIKELIVSPVDAPTNWTKLSYAVDRAPSWQSRPFCNLVEAKVVDEFLLQIMEPLTPMLKAQFNMWYDVTCTDRCLFYAPVARVIPGISDRMIFVFFHFTDNQEDYYLWPVPLKMLLTTPGNGAVYTVKSVTYNDVDYDTIQALVDAYNAGNISTSSPGVEQEYAGRYGSPNRRGEDLNPGNLPPPSVTSAKRFTVQERHASWLGWEFDFSFATISAIQLFNIKYKNERIAYQLGLQDILVLYTGGDMDQAFRMYMDVGWAIGARTSTLRRGYDCPESAEYVDSSVYDVGFDRSINIRDAACVFEYRNHVPLRRHYSVDYFNYESFRFTMSMQNVVLVFRQILTVWNYDYIMDIEFHQSGVIKTSVNPTGYVQVISAGSADIRYGYSILPNASVTALLHNHAFDFVADLDIGNSNSNRFMTLDIEAKQKPHPYNSAVNMSYMVMTENTKATEQEAIINFDFSQPKQYVVFNKNETNLRNYQPRGYRIHSGNFVNVVIPDDPVFNAASWVRHQVAVTKYKDSERSTLSFFSQGDPFNPPVSLSHFQEDNESILDQDLVCWITLGVNHVPTSEDVPVTTTAGKSMSFYLIPYNYFEEDPSIASKDAQVEYPST